MPSWHRRLQARRFKKEALPVGMRPSGVIPVVVCRFVVDVPDTSLPSRHIPHVADAPERNPRSVQIVVCLSPFGSHASPIVVSHARAI
jgi:hypothetical protein